MWCDVMWCDWMWADVMWSCVGYMPSRDGYMPSCVGYMPSCVGYMPSCVGYCVGYMPSCIGYTPYCDVMECDGMWWNVVWCDVMWCDVVWCDWMWADVMWCELMWFNVMWLKQFFRTVSYYDIMLHMDLERSSHDIDVVTPAFMQWRLFLFLVVSCVVAFATYWNDSHLKWESCLWVANTTTHETTTQVYYLML